MNRSLPLLIVSLVLAGCISAPPRGSFPPSAGMPGGEAASPENPASPSSRNSASALLLQQGQAERGAGLYQDATTSIERALRIDPNNPRLWIELGEIKYDEGDREQAAMMARKALTLAAGDRTIESRADRLIGR